MVLVIISLSHNIIQKKQSTLRINKLWLYLFLVVEDNDLVIVSLHKDVLRKPRFLYNILGESWSCL